VSPDHPACHAATAAVQARIDGLGSSGLGKTSGGRSCDSLHRQLGDIMIGACGISRHAKGLRAAMAEVRALEQAFAQELRLPEPRTGRNPELEKALRLEDFLQLAGLMLRDALAREESCGAHFREEHQSADGEALRDDANFCHIAAWQWTGEGQEPIRHVEPLHYRHATPSRRNYR
jgi:succinate dehydrogenase / fumarate reductase flavoprotein subunit